MNGYNDMKFANSYRKTKTKEQQWCEWCVSSVCVCVGAGLCGGLTELDGAVHPQQDVVALDVSMDHLVRVEELQRLQTLHRTKMIQWAPPNFVRLLRKPEPPTVSGLLPLCTRQQSELHPCRFLSQHLSENLRPGTPSPPRARLQPGSCTKQ